MCITFCARWDDCSQFPAETVVGARHIFASAGSGRSSDHARRRTTGHNVGQLLAVALQLTSPRPAIACSRFLLAQKSDGHPGSVILLHPPARASLQGASGVADRPHRRTTARSCPTILRLGPVSRVHPTSPTGRIVGQLLAVVLQSSGSGQSPGCIRRRRPAAS